MRKISIFVFLALASLLFVVVVFVLEGRGERALGGNGALAGLGVKAEGASGGVGLGGALLSGEVRLRFAPSQHPFSSEEAASRYYARYRELLFPDLSNPGLVDVEVLAKLTKGEDLHLALGQVGDLEVVDAVPKLIDLLSSSDLSLIHI